MCLPGIGFARFARAGPGNKFRFGSFYYNKDSLEEFYKLKYCSTVVYMVPRA